MAGVDRTCHQQRFPQLPIHAGDSLVDAPFDGGRRIRVPEGMHHARHDGPRGNRGLDPLFPKRQPGDGLQPLFPKRQPGDGLQPLFPDDGSTITFPRLPPNDTGWLTPPVPTPPAPAGPNWPPLEVISDPYPPCDREHVAPPVEGGGEGWDKPFPEPVEEPPVRKGPPDNWHPPGELPEESAPTEPPAPIDGWNEEWITAPDSPPVRKGPPDNWHPPGELPEESTPTEPPPAPINGYYQRWADDIEIEI